MAFCKFIYMYNLSGPQARAEVGALKAAGVKKRVLLPLMRAPGVLSVSLSLLIQGALFWELRQVHSLAILSDGF